MSGCTCCFWVPFGYFPSVWLSRWLTPLFVHRLHCRRCGFDHDPVSVWNIGSYTDYCERHILRVKDPITGKCIGWIDCPQCGSTILL